MKQNGAPTAQNPRPRLGLALSGGVMRGPTHVGVLSVLIRAGIPIDYVAGTSIGALVGALYCAGLPLDAMREIAMRTSWLDVAGPTLSWQGMVSFAKLESWMTEFIGDITFADLKYPFAIVATDMERGEPVVLRAGPVAPAIRASCSVPGMVPPFRLNGRLLADGGVSYNMPAQVVRDLGATHVIGVDLFVPKLRTALGSLGVGFAALETMIRRSGGGVDGIDLLISPNLSGRSYVRTSDSYQLMRLGEEAMTEKMDDLEKLLRYV